MLAMLMSVPAEQTVPRVPQVPHTMLLGSRRFVVLSFALAYDMVVANTLFRKRESHLVTFSSGLHSSQIDFVLSRREDRRACIDCKVIPGESVVPQHKLVVTDFRFRVHVQRGKR